VHSTAEKPALAPVEGLVDDERLEFSGLSSKYSSFLQAERAAEPIHEPGDHLLHLNALEGHPQLPFGAYLVNVEVVVDRAMTEHRIPEDDAETEIFSADPSRWSQMTQPSSYS
jgi:hypothetical protein